jgi:hypothetical protein
MVRRPRDGFERQAKSRERRAQVLRYAGRDVDSLSRDWMLERDPMGMQRQSTKVVCRAIVPIDLPGAMRNVTDEWMVDVTEMAPYLMQTPRLGDGEDERTSVDGRTRDAPEARHGGDAGAAFFLRNRVIDDPAVGRGPSNQRDVLLFDAAILECPRKARGRFASPREEKCAARAAIESMHRVDLLAERVSYTEESHVIVVVPAAMNEKAGRLVRHDDVRVDEKELDRGRTAGGVHQ